MVVDPINAQEGTAQDYDAWCERTSLRADGTYERTPEQQAILNEVILEARKKFREVMVPTCNHMGVQPDGSSGELSIYDHALDQIRTAMGEGHAPPTDMLNMVLVRFADIIIALDPAYRLEFAFTPDNVVTHTFVYANSSHGHSVINLGNFIMKSLKDEKLPVSSMMLETLSRIRKGVADRN